MSFSGQGAVRLAVEKFRNFRLAGIAVYIIFAEFSDYFCFVLSEEMYQNVLLFDFAYGYVASFCVPFFVSVARI